MSGFAGSRKRILIWTLVKLLLTMCDQPNDARVEALRGESAGAMALNYPLLSGALDRTSCTSEGSSHAQEAFSQSATSGNNLPLFRHPE
jgi:hypothetical protein